MTNKQQAINERKHLAPADLEQVRTVFGYYVFIPRNRKPGQMIPVYKRTGAPVVGRFERGLYYPFMLHPENIYRPDMRPLNGDYLALAHANGEPSENHAEIFMTRATVTEGVYLVETMDSEMYTVTRYPELDNDIRRAWKQVQP